MVKKRKDKRFKQIRSIKHSKTALHIFAATIVSFGTLLQFVAIHVPHMLFWLQNNWPNLLPFFQTVFPNIKQTEWADSLLALSAIADYWSIK